MHRRPHWSAALVLMGLGALSSIARAEDWTRFRGPDGSGISATAFSDPISASDFLWKIDLPGAGHSSPVIFGGKLYLTSADADAGKRIVLCYNSADGKALWQREYPFSTFRQHADNSFASASPAVDDLGVYVAWTTPDAYTLTALAHDGGERWKVDLGRFVSQWGSGASPVIVDGLVVVAMDQEGPKSAVVAVDRKTGDIKWRIDRKSGNKAACSTPAIFRPKSGGPPQLILTSKANGVTSLDPKTGKTNWELSDAMAARTVGSPVCTDEMVLADCGDGSTQRELVAIRPGNEATDKPAVAYKMTKGAPYVLTPIIKGDLAFLWGDAGTVTCIHAATGEAVWSEKVGGAYYGSPVCAGDTLWCMSRKGDLVGVAATDTFKLVGKLSLGEASHSTPAIADGRMYLRTVSHLICVGKK